MKAIINTEGLDVEMKCLICTNPFKTNKGCDGACRYDEELYNDIMNAIEDRITFVSTSGEQVNPCIDCQEFDCSDCNYWT